MGKQSPQQRVTQYFMSLHFGMCYGPIDHITRIKINDKVAWGGNKNGGVPIEINLPELFGGIKKEGGFIGAFQLLPGDESQTIPEVLAAKAERTTATMPAYRGQASIWFYEGAGQPKKGAYWSANQPFIPSVEVMCSRSPVGLSGESRIWRPADENLLKQTENPALEPPWSSIATDAIVVAGLPDPFGENKAFSLQDTNATVGFADRVTQNISSVDLDTLQRFIVSVYIKRDVAQSIFSAMILFTGSDETILTYDHFTDSIDVVAAAGQHTIHQSGMLSVPGQPAWRRLFLDISQFGVPLLAWGFTLCPAFGSTGNFPGPEESSPTGTIVFDGPMIQRIPPVT